MKEEARTTLRIDPELFTKMKKRAEHLGITLNQYVERLARIDLEEFDQELPDNVKRPPARMTISLSEEERDRIQARAREAHCSPKELFIRLMDRTCQATITISVLDIMAFEETIDAFISTIYAVAKVILRTEKAFPADLRRILECTDKIYAAFARIIHLETDLRSELYEEARSIPALRKHPRGRRS